MGYKSTEEDL